MSKENAVYLITGVMAAGKSTVAQLLSERFDKSVHVRGDVFRKMIVNGEMQMSDNLSAEALEQLRLRYRLAANVSDMYAEAGFHTVVQDVIIGPMLEEMVKLISYRPLYVIVLAPRADIIAARESARKKKGYGDISIESLDAVLQSETPRLGLWLDSSEMTPEETVGMIYKGLETAAKIK
ncbi:AAA family ATPase [Bacillus halotolerans]|uniref:AAA family ATPase n=1 Tax=Bacillus halotolerans TaxID=260554 RepID=UPI0027E59B02|nr:AAA family ATPase [Bacillus halotolerans]MDQ7724790.1 AAA family ATPase [Bacillus halotolerans]